MATTYPRQNEWSFGSGIGTGLGGAENSEYSNRPRCDSYYGGQGSFGGGLDQFGEEGRHAGRGPKGYKRSDERIREDINERLTRDPQVDAGEIETYSITGVILQASYTFLDPYDNASNRDAKRANPHARGVSYDPP
jgi:hypothetical protein